MTTPSQPSVPSITELDAGWGELLDGLDDAPAGAVAPADAPIVAEPRRCASQTLARMAAMMDAREGTGPVLDLRTVLGPHSRPADDPEVGAPVAEVHEDASLDVSEVDLLELGAPAEILDEVPVVVPAEPAAAPIRDAPAIPVAVRQPPPRPRVWTAIGTGAVAAAVLGWWSVQSGDEARSAAVRSAAIPPAAAASLEVEDPPIVAPRPAPTRSDPAPAPAPVVPEVLAKADAPAIEPPEPAAVEPVAVEPVAVEPVAVEPVAVEPVAVASVDGSTVAEARAAFDAGRFADAHAIADRRWSETRDNEALEIMVASACALDDGKLARAAFRSLSGPQVRATVYVQCRRRGIDLRARTQGYTAGELLIRARRAAAQGDHEQARTLARESLQVARSAEAMLLVGVSACRLGKIAEAQRLVSRLHRDEQAALRADCSSAGVEL